MAEEAARVAAALADGGTEEREAVYAAWSDPDQRKVWSGCQGSTCTSFTHDFQVGGSYRQVLEVPNCGEIVMIGAYTAIDEPGELAYSMNWEAKEGMPQTPDSNVRVTFAEKDGGTELCLVHTGLADEQSCDSAYFTGGWA